MVEHPDNTFVGALRKARTEIGFMLIRVGAEIAMKNTDSYKLYLKHNGKLELVGELTKSDRRSINERD